MENVKSLLQQLESSFKVEMAPEAKLSPAVSNRIRLGSKSNAKLISARMDKYIATAREHELFTRANLAQVLLDQIADKETPQIWSAVDFLLHLSQEGSWCDLKREQRDKVAKSQNENLFFPHKDFDEQLFSRYNETKSVFEEFQEVDKDEDMLEEVGVLAVDPILSVPRLGGCSERLTDDFVINPFLPSNQAIPTLPISAKINLSNPFGVLKEKRQQKRKREHQSVEEFAASWREVKRSWQKPPPKPPAIPKKPVINTGENWVDQTTWKVDCLLLEDFYLSSSLAPPPLRTEAEVSRAAYNILLGCQTELCTLEDGILKPVRCRLQCLNEHVISKVLQDFCECGTQFRRLEHRVGSLLSEPELGVLTNNFCSAVKDFLTYYRCVIVRLMETNPSLLEANLRSQKLRDQLNVICDLCMLSEPKENFPNRTHLLSHVFHACLTCLGHPTPILHYFFYKIAQPYVHILNEWLAHGRIADPHSDVFLLKNQNKHYPKVTLRAPPLFLSAHISHIESFGESMQIFKSILTDVDFFLEPIELQQSKKSLRHALQAPLDPEEICQKFQIKNPFLYKNLQDEVQEKITKIILRNGVEVDFQICKLFKDDLRLQWHVSNLRKFYLLYQGDLMSAFCKALYERASSRFGIDLNEPSHVEFIWQNTIKEYGYTNLESLNKFSFKRPPSHDFTTRNVIKNIFLHYEVSWPISEIIDESCLLQYNEVFKFQLRMRHVYHQLQDVWWRFQRRDPKSNSVTNIHTFQIFRQLCHHIMMNLITFFDFQVIEVHWKTFVDDLNKASNLHQIRKCHADYVERLLRACFLKEDQQRFRKQLESLIQLIEDFNISFKKLDFGAGDNSAMKKVMQEFIKQSKLLLKLAKNKGGPAIQALMLKLDFNGYFTSKSRILQRSTDPAFNRFRRKRDSSAVTLKKAEEFLRRTGTPRRTKESRAQFWPKLFQNKNKPKNTEAN